MSVDPSIPDFVSLVQSAHRTFRSCQRAGQDYVAIASGVRCLHSVLRTLRSESLDGTSNIFTQGEAGLAELIATAGRCRNVLDALDYTLAKYEGLASDGQSKSAKKLWQRFRSRSKAEELETIRSQLITYTAAISVLLDAMRYTVSEQAEGKLDGPPADGSKHLDGQFEQIRREIYLAAIKSRAMDKKQGTMSSLSLHTHFEDEERVWQEFREVLVRKGFRSASLERHQLVLEAYMAKLGQSGLLDQDVVLPTAQVNEEYWKAKMTYSRPFPVVNKILYRTVPRVLVPSAAVDGTADISTGSLPLKTAEMSNSDQLVEEEGEEQETSESSDHDISNQADAFASSAPISDTDTELDKEILGLESHMQSKLTQKTVVASIALKTMTLLLKAKVEGSGGSKPSARPTAPSMGEVVQLTNMIKTTGQVNAPLKDNQEENTISSTNKLDESIAPYKTMNKESSPTTALMAASPRPENLPTSATISSQAGTTKQSMIHKSELNIELADSGVRDPRSSITVHTRRHRTYASHQPIEGISIDGSSQSTQHRDRERRRISSKSSSSSEAWVQSMTVARNRSKQGNTYVPSLRPRSMPVSPVPSPPPSSRQRIRHRRTHSTPTTPRSSLRIAPEIHQVTSSPRVHYQFPSIGIVDSPSTLRVSSSLPLPRPRKGILKPPTPHFPEDPTSAREGIAIHKDAGKGGTSLDARWTKISRSLVNPEALEAGKERFEATDESVIVLRVVTRDDIDHYAEVTRKIRAGRENDVKEDG